MNIGIVGHEAAKFTPETELVAREVIRVLLADPADVLVSGHCPLGGIDIWAEEESDALGRKKIIYPPLTHSWEDGYKPRNLQIAETSDICYCLVVRELPPTYTGMRFTSCYHCHTTSHVKSGGCWTAKRCKRREWIYI